MRHFKVTLLIGFASALLVLLLTATGWISTTPDIMLGKALGFSGRHAALTVTQIVAFALVAFGIAWTTVDISRFGHKTLVATAALILLITWTLTLSLYKVYFSPFPASVAVLLSYGMGVAYGRTRAGSRKRNIELLFAHRVSKSDFAKLLNSSASAEFPGDQVVGTVVVCEIRNQDELIEFLAPQDYAAMSNLYLQTASDYLVEVGGYLDECTGESLRVVFGAPLPDSNHAVKACRAALDLLSRLDLLNKECDATWQRRFDFRIGINSGDMIGAAFGSNRLANYSVSGPAVEFARKLSLACGTYGARILVGPETFDQAPEAFEARPIEVLKGTGDRRRIELYEILSPKHGLSPERERSRDDFWRGVLYFREKKWDKALEAFQQSRITGIPDAVLDFYMRRVETARRGGRDTDSQQALLFDSV